MPWWVILYLVLLAAMIGVALIKDYRDKGGFFHMLAEFFSGVIGFVFIYALFHPELGTLIGWLALPLLAYAIIWDQYAMRTMEKSAYADLSEQENADMDSYSKLFAFLFILPCYIAGVIISLQSVGF